MANIESRTLRPLSWNCEPLARDTETPAKVLQKSTSDHHYSNSYSTAISPLPFPPPELPMSWIPVNGGGKPTKPRWRASTQIAAEAEAEFRQVVQQFSGVKSDPISLPFVASNSKKNKDHNNAVKIYTRRDSMEIEQPAKLAELGTDPENEGVISDLLRFARDKEFCKMAGKAWKRGYLFNDSPGTDRSSLIAAMANRLEFDVYNLDLTGLSSISELTDVLIHSPQMLGMANAHVPLPLGSHLPLRYLPQDEPIYVNAKQYGAILRGRQYRSKLKPQNNLSKAHKLTLSGLLKIIHGLLLSCGDERIIVLTTNHNHSDRVDATLLRLLSIDLYIHTSSPQPIALPDGGEIVQLDSSQQKPLVDFDATNNRVLVSYSEEKNTREASRRQCMTESVLHLRECLTKSILSLDDSKEDLQQHSGGRRGDAEKSFGAIYDPGIPTTDSLSQKSFEVLETLPTQEEPNDCVPLLSVGRLTLEGCIQEEKSPDLPRVMQINGVEQRVTKLFRYLGGLTAQSASSSCWPIGLPDGRHVLLLHPVEQSTKNVAHAAKADQCSPTVSLPEKKKARKTLTRECRTMSVIFEIHQQHFGRRCVGTAKSFGGKRLQLIQCCFQSCSFTNHVMLLAKDMLYCSLYGSSTRLLLSHPYSGPHAATCICRKDGINRVSTMKRIHKQHGIHQWPFRQKWAIRKGYSVGDERPFEASSLSMDEKLDSRLQFIHMSQFGRSSPQRLALPDGGEIVRPTALSSSEFAAANNRAHLVGQDQTGSIASHYERKNTRETSDKQGLTMSLRSVEDLEQHFGCKHKVVVKSLGVSLSMFKSTCRQHWVYWRQCRFENNEQAFDATNNRAPLVKADESSPTMSNSEKGSTREAFKRDCLTKDVRQHFGARRKDLVDGLCDSLAWKSFEVLDSLPLGEQSNSIKRLARQRTLTHKHFVRLKKSPYLPRSLQRDCSGGLAAQSDIGLPDGGHILSLSEKKTVRKTLKRKCRTMSVLSLEDHQQHVGCRWEDDVKFLGAAHAAKRICRQLAIHRESTAKRIHRQHGTRRWPLKQSAIDLPNGGHILYHSKKKIVRKTLKRKCRMMSVLSLDYHQHVDIRWEDAVKSLGAKRIHRQLVIHCVSTTKRIRRQHGIHRWLFQQNWATMKGDSLGDERPFEVMSLSANAKLVSRLQRIHISWLGRFAPRPSALPGGGEIVGPIALSSSEFASTNNKAQRVGHDKSDSAASDSKKKRTREQEDREEINTSITLDDLRQHYGRKRKDVAESLGVSVSTLKRTCRQYGIKRWPNIIRKKAGRPPDQHVEKNPSPTCKMLSTNGQHEMENEIVGHLKETNEFLLDFVEGPNGRNMENASMVEIVTILVFIILALVIVLIWVLSVSYMYNENEGGGVSSEWAFQLKDQWTVSTSYPNSNGPEVPHPHIASTRILGENMGSLGDKRNSFCSLEEHLLQGPISGSMWAVPPCSDPPSIQHMPTITPAMGSSEDRINSLALVEDVFLEEDVSGSIRWTIPTCFEPAPSQLMPTVPRTTGSS
ncbi:hypothetical protein RHMOL_Rhmol05G0027200 [Rhododendron molle]|uniref:Uncharacterized protein n=1 Tax=Rhododendron molle TaxID=49168 RepID=A0ACC0NLA1_RHOML|nr:hypothetical protein RHMOL_Rhmol05G0027200 [Rhododendron molle]